MSTNKYGDVTIETPRGPSLQLSLSLPQSRVTALREVRRLLGGPGEFWECGVYKGYTAELIHNAIGDDRTLRLFDTFAGCPEAGPEDTTRWDWATTLPEVQAIVHGPHVHYHVGRIPETFAGLEAAEIAFVYLDVTLYQGTRDTLRFVIPRLVPGGVIFVRDYVGSREKWPGVVRAVDEVLRNWFTRDFSLEVVGYDGVIRV
jgi:hypothetical protein